MLLFEYLQYVVGIVCLIVGPARLTAATFLLSGMPACPFHISSRI